MDNVHTIHVLLALARGVVVNLDAGAIVPRRRCPSRHLELQELQLRSSVDVAPIEELDLLVPAWGDNSRSARGGPKVGNWLTAIRSHLNSIESEREPYAMRLRGQGGRAATLGPLS
jgi:hypothetical protein